VDCWSLGIVLHEIIADCRPFDFGASTRKEQEGSGLTDYAIAMSQSRSTFRTRESVGIDRALAKRIVQQPIKLDKGRWLELPDVRKLVLGLLDRDTEKRFTIKQALDSAWVLNSNGLGLLKQRYYKHVLEPFNITLEIGHPS